MKDLRYILKSHCSYSIVLFKKYIILRILKALFMVSNLYDIINIIYSIFVI